MKIAVVFGGESEERDVSIASGLQVIDGLRSCGHEIVAIDTAMGVLAIDEQKQLQGFQVQSSHPSSSSLVQIKTDPLLIVRNALELNDIDAVFIALHGGSGEDGSLQALLEMSGIPFTGTGRVGSMLAMDKDISKRILQVAGIPTPEWIMCSPTDVPKTNPLGYPVIVKPNAQGSTVGLSLVSKPDDLVAAVAKAAEFGNEIMLERFISGREFTVGILEDKPLAVGEIIVNTEVFDYESKYQVGGAKEIFPAQISPKQTEFMQRLGLQTHQALKLNAYSRIDFRMDESGGIWVLEANTVPGLTSLSLLPQSAKAAGITFPELCDTVCKLAVMKS